MVSKGLRIRDMNDDAAAAAIVDRLEGPFREFVFSSWDSEFLETPEGQQGMRIALVDRYLASRRHAVAWLDDAVGLSGKTVVEVGCGTGSSTVALAERGAKVIAIDIDEPSVSAARCRVGAHQVEGVTIEQCEADQILVRALEKEADLYVLFAVLEHLTEAERFETMQGLWRALKPGGAVAVIETPNRLSYFDSHSSEQDFVHLLPDDLAFRLKDRSPRRAYRDVMGHAAAESDAAAAHLTRIRFGLGASYHEFLAAVDDPLDEIVIADGFEEAITSWFGSNLEETTLIKYMLERDLGVPMGFGRAVLNLVLRKPVDDAARRAASLRNRARREELSKIYAQPPAEPKDDTELQRQIARQAKELERLRAEPSPLYGEAQWGRSSSARERARSLFRRLPTPIRSRVKRLMGR